MKKVLTQEDFDLNPELEEQGFKVGDEIEIPDEEKDGADETAFGPGGTTPPGNPPTKP